MRRVHCGYTRPVLSRPSAQTRSGRRTMEAPSGTKPWSTALPSRRSCLAGLAAASLVGPAFGKDRFRPLFNGANLNGWTPVGDANWQVSDGLVWGDKGKGGFLVAAESYSNFDLR